MTLEPLRLASAAAARGARTERAAVEGYRLVARDDLQWLADRPMLRAPALRGRGLPALRHGAAPRRRDRRRASSCRPASTRARSPGRGSCARARAARGADADARSRRRVLRHIRTGGYSYTLAPGDYGRDAIDEFWLDRKNGFCEHFAAAFVVVMRALGVPARIVTGYQGADPTPVDGYYVVRQSSAHAWAEYWQAGARLGPRRPDRRGGARPHRRSRSLAPQPGLVAGAFGSDEPGALAQLRARWEALNNRWNQWVLNYTRGQQLDLLKNLGFDRRPGKT